MNKPSYAEPIIWGLCAAGILLVVFFAAATAISGRAYAQEQFNQFWPYLVSLAAGFGAQVGLYTYLKQLTKNASGKTLAATGTTSTLSMLTCCAHYLVNILPVIGVTGLLAFIAQYQIQFFWLGLAANLGGLIFIVSRIIKFRKEAHEN